MISYVIQSTSITKLAPLNPCLCPYRLCSKQCCAIKPKIQSLPAKANTTATIFFFIWSYLSDTRLFRCTVPTHIAFGLDYVVIVTTNWLRNKMSSPSRMGNDYNYLTSTQTARSLNRPDSAEMPRGHLETAVSWLSCRIVPVPFTPRGWLRISNSLVRLCCER